MTQPLSWNLHGNDQLSSVLEKLDKTLNKISRSLDGATTDARQMGTAMGGAESPTRRLGTAADDTSNRLERLRGRLSSAAGMAAQFGVSVVAAAAIATAALAGIGLSTAMANEQAAISFELLLGNAQKASKFLAELQKFAAATPFEMPQLRTAASRLLAVGVATKDIIPLLESLGDATSGMGTGAEGIERAVTALTQMQMKTKVSAEEMLQLTEAGIPAWQALAAVLNVDVQTAMKMVEKRTVESGKVFEAIQGKAGPAMKRLDGMMERQSATLAGVWSTFKDNAGQALAKFAEPMLPGLKKIVDWAGTNLPKALDKIREWGAKPEVQELFSGIKADIKEIAGNAAPLLVDGIKRFAQAVIDNKEEIRLAIKVITSVLAFLVIGAVELGTVMVNTGAFVVNAFKFMARWALTAADIQITAMTRAFGWVPGLGGKLKEAEASFTAFREHINHELGLIESPEIKVGITATGRRSRGQARASGGPVWPGEVYTWQEQGDEKLAVGSSGRVMSNEEVRSSASRGGGGEILGYLEVVHKTPDGEVIRTELLELKRRRGFGSLGLA